MRSLWLHYPDDPEAVRRGDEYLWGRDILVAPVVEKGATSRRLYLPRGHWFDFWTSERHDGGREIERAVDLETLPLFIREGAILPLGPVKQYVNEKIDAPLTITIYPGADGECLFYEDDGISFNYRRGDWMGLQLKWKDSQRTLTLHLVTGSRMRAPLRRDIEVKVGDSVHLTISFNECSIDLRGVIHALIGKGLIFSMFITPALMMCFPFLMLGFYEPGIYSIRLRARRLHK